MDKLQQMYTEWLKLQNPEVIDPDTAFIAFQGGLTAGAVSMRQRAVKVVQDSKLLDNPKNEIVNKIGQLSDIPQ